MSKKNKRKIVPVHADKSGKEIIDKSNLSRISSSDLSNKFVYIKYHPGGCPKGECSESGSKIQKYRLQRKDGSWYEAEVNQYKKTQSFLPQTDVKTIVARMSIDPEVLNARRARAQYGDISDVPENILETLVEKELEAYDNNAFIKEVNKEGVAPLPVEGEPSANKGLVVSPASASGTAPALGANEGGE